MEWNKLVSGFGKGVRFYMCMPFDIAILLPETGSNYTDGQRYIIRKEDTALLTILRNWRPLNVWEKAIG